MPKSAADGLERTLVGFSTMVESSAMAIKKLAAWDFISLLETDTKESKQLTGLANHLFPPISNQLKCPPSEVLQSTV